MEWVDGVELGKLVCAAALSGRRLPVDVVAAIARDMLAGLHAAHECRREDGLALHVVRRDVSPQNVLVGFQGAARVADFGVATAACRQQHTEQGSIKGKLRYLAPEQLRSGNGIEVLVEILQSQPVAPSATARGAACLDAVVMRALERNPDERVASSWAPSAPSARRRPSMTPTRALRGAGASPRWSRPSVRPWHEMLPARTTPRVCAIGAARDVNVSSCAATPTRLALLPGPQLALAGVCRSFALPPSPGVRAVLAVVDSASGAASASFADSGVLGEGPESGQLAVAIAGSQAAPGVVVLETRSDDQTFSLHDRDATGRERRRLKSISSASTASMVPRGVVLDVQSGRVVVFARRGSGPSGFVLRVWR